MKVPRLSFTIVLCLLSIGMTAVADNGNGTISGSVIDEAGNPISAARVYYKNSPNVVRDRTGHTRVLGLVVSSTAISAKDGTFSVTGLAPGVYWLCAESLQANQIRSCDWGFGSTKADLTTATSAAGLKLQVHDGVTVTFNVTDTRSQIKDFVTPTNAQAALVPAPPGNFRIFLVDGTWLMHADAVSTVGPLHQYAVTVPKGRSPRMLLDTKLTVVNQTQQSVTSGQLGATVATTSGQAVTYNLVVQ